MLQLASMEKGEVELPERSASGTFRGCMMLKGEGEPLCVHCHSCMGGDDGELQGRKS